MTRGALALLLALAASPAAAQTAAPVLRPAVDPDTVAVGERFRTGIVVALPPGAALEASVEGDTTGEAWALGPARVHPPADGADEHRVAVTMAAWRPGALPPETALVVVRYADGTVFSADVPLALPFVRPVLPADTSLHEPRPAKDVLGPDAAPVWPRIALALVVLLLLAWVAWLLRRRRRAIPATRRAPADARSRALEALREAEASGLAEAGEWAAFYARVSGALRRFLAETERSWSLPLTSAELVATLRRDGVDEARIAVLDPLLSRADLAKFARRGFAADDARRDVAQARAWVERFAAPPRLSDDAFGGDADGGSSPRASNGETAVSGDPDDASSSRERAGEPVPRDPRNPSPSRDSGGDARSRPADERGGER